MRRARLALLLAATGLLLGAAPSVAVADRGAGLSTREREALDLLQAAARAGRDLTYTGTQQVATWRGPQAGSATAEVHHDPARGSTVDADEPLAVTAVLDPRLLRLLASSYDLAVAGPGTCTGRSARVVEASRADGSLAGRFWVDHDSGLLLRREVFDDRGRRLRSSAFVELSVGAGTASVAPAQQAALPAETAVAGLRADGWDVPRTLPGGLRLFATELTTPRPGGQLLHLAYSDGLSSVSLFEQRGRLGSAPLTGFRPAEVDGRPVWVRDAAPERVVWDGGGRVWTMVSDAPPATVRAAVAELPHDGAGSADGGVRTRLGRGLGRLGSLLNPFD